jgi:hypothetical protein
MNSNEEVVRRIAVRLVARLEGVRRSYTANSERAVTEFRRIAREHVHAEITAAGFESKVAERLDTEIQESLLPRYGLLAIEMNERERTGFGFGAASSTLGRLVTTAGALLVVWVLLIRLLFVPAAWPFLVLAISFPFWPDIAASVYRGHYRRSLDEAVNQLVQVVATGEPSDSSPSDSSPSDSSPSDSSPSDSSPSDSSPSEQDL